MKVSELIAILKLQKQDAEITIVGIESFGLESCGLKVWAHPGTPDNKNLNPEIII
jgi:hypothetical protein